MTNFDPSLEGPPEPVVVTQADEQAAKAAAMDVYCANSDVLCGADVEEMEKALALAFARHRLSHTLPDERLRVAVEALKFYAKPGNWGVYRISHKPIRDQRFTRATDDRGETARQALASLQEKAP